MQGADIDFSISVIQSLFSVSHEKVIKIILYVEIYSKRLNMLDSDVDCLLLCVNL